MDREAHVWDATAEGSARRRHALRGHVRDVVACAYSGDGSMVATVALDKTLIVWDVTGKAARQELARGNGHRKAVLCVGWSKDSSRLATGSEDKTVRVWRVPEGVEKGDADVELETVCRLRGHEEAVVALAFARGSRPLICTGSLDQTVRLWDWESGKELMQMLHPQSLLGCAFSLSGAFIGSICLDSSIRIFDVSGEGAVLVDQAPAVRSGSLVGAAFRISENGQEELALAVVQPPSTIILPSALFLPPPAFSDPA